MPRGSMDSKLEKWSNQLDLLAVAKSRLRQISSSLASYIYTPQLLSPAPHLSSETLQASQMFHFHGSL